jgi:hypothetical protein
MKARRNMIGLARDLLKVLPGVLAAIFVGLVTTLFLVFPRVVNELANVLGNMGDPLNLGDVIVHWAVALLIWAVIGYLFIYRPLNRFRLARSTRGLLVRRGQGIGFIDAESVRQQLYAAVARIAEVQGMEVSVINDLGKAEIHLNILSGNRINGAQKKTEVRREIKRVVEDQLGVFLAKEPVINIKLVPIFEDLKFAAPADAPYASALSGLQRLPAPVVPGGADLPVIETPTPAPKSAPSRPTERVYDVDMPPAPKAPTPEAVNGPADLTAQPVISRRPFVSPTPAEPLPDMPAPEAPPVTAPAPEKEES